MALPWPRPYWLINEVENSWIPPKSHFPFGHWHRRALLGYTGKCMPSVPRTSSRGTYSV